MIFGDAVRVFPLRETVTIPESFGVEGKRDKPAFAEAFRVESCCLFLDAATGARNDDSGKLVAIGVVFGNVEQSCKFDSSTLVRDIVFSGLHHDMPLGLISVNW